MQGAIVHVGHRRSRKRSCFRLYHINYFQKIILKCMIIVGPMVYGIAFCPVNKTELLESLECADSKALTEEKRDEIFTKICNANNTVGWAIEVISPNKICNSMLQRAKHSLNEVSMDAAIALVRAAAEAGVNISHVYVDTVGPPEKYQAYLSRLFPNYKITVAKKADSTYPIVSAASICAKVARDHALQVWQFKEGVEMSHKEFGSGYPADPVTKKYLATCCDPVFGYPQLVRFSWSTAVNALEENAYYVEWEENEEKPKTPPNNTSITSFFKMTKQDSAKKDKHEFFKQRMLSNCVDF